MDEENRVCCVAEKRKRQSSFQTRSHFSFFLTFFLFDSVLTYERVERQDFTAVIRTLEAAGELATETEYAFEFPTVEKQYDSYVGINARLRCVPCLFFFVCICVGLSLLLLPMFLLCLWSGTSFG